MSKVPNLIQSLSFLGGECRLEYPDCGKAFPMDSSRLKSGEDPQELRGGKIIWLLWIFLKIRFVTKLDGENNSPPSPNSVTLI